MDGHIWIESEGLDKGSTATFVVKLGICNNPNEEPGKHMVPRAQLHEGNTHTAGNKPLSKDDRGVPSLVPRYQRSA